MLTFLTLFLGIASGPRNVELSAGDAVATIELRLDGTSLGRLAGPPWSTVVDFGDPPKPHELLALGFDIDGKEIARVVQRINLSRSLAEATLQLLPGSGGKGRFVQLTWKCAVAGEPARTRVTFDGKPIAAPDPSRIPLPAYAPEQLHFMRAEVDFPRNLTAAAEILFGGQNRDETQAELTAVAVLAARKKLPPLDDAFVARGEPLRVVAVEEEGPGEIVIVLDDAARPLLASVAARSHRIGSGIDALRRIAPLSRDQRARFVWPVTEAFQHGNTRYEIFPCSEDFGRVQGGLLFLLTHVVAPGILPDPRLADAVAVAALTAVGRSRARAVVLVLGGSPDTSLLSPGGARGYLSALGVPLFVWTVGPRGLAAGADWTGAPDVADISTTGLFEKAADRLFAYMKRQRIVWVEGIHLPQDVALSTSAQDLTLVH
jgi:hypothetical protein